MGERLAGGATRGASIARLALRSLNVLPVATAKNDGEAIWGLLVMHLCTKVPAGCAAVAVTSLFIEAGEARQGLIDNIRARYPGDSYGERAESLIKMSCLYPTAACRQ